MKKVKSLVFDVLLVALFLYVGISFAALSPKASASVPNAVNIQSVTQWVYQWVDDWTT